MVLPFRDNFSLPYRLAKFPHQFHLYTTRSVTQLILTQENLTQAETSQARSKSYNEEDRTQTLEEDSLTA